MSENSEKEYSSVVTWEDEEGLTHRGAPESAGYKAYLERKAAKADTSEPDDAKASEPVVEAIKPPVGGATRSVAKP